MSNPVRSTVNYWHSWQFRCRWHRFAKVFRDTCFNLEECLKRGVGSLAETKFKAVCCIDGVDSNSRSLASLYFGCFLLFAFEDILSPPAVTHKHIFRAGVSNKIQQQKSSESKESPTAAQRFAFIRPLESQAVVQLSDSSQSLRLFYRAPAAHKSHTSSCRIWLSSTVRGSGTWYLCQLEKWFRWRERQQVWLSSASGASPVHPLMTRYHQGRRGDVRRYHGDKHRHTFLPSSIVSSQTSTWKM